MKSGKLITFYGINNIGKTTHAHLLTKHLCDDGFDAVYIKFPVYDLEPTGRYLNSFLRNSTNQKQSITEEELQMWFTLNRFQFQPTLNTWLSEGKIVIAEDYIGTGIAWGMTKGADEAWLEMLNRDLRHEDFALLLEGERAMKAREESHIHESDNELVERARANFSHLGTRHGWKRVQIGASKEESAENIYREVKNFLSAE